MRNKCGKGRGEGEGDCYVAGHWQRQMTHVCMAKSCYISSLVYNRILINIINLSRGCSASPFACNKYNIVISFLNK